MSAPASPALDQALQLADAARRAELEELAFLVSFLKKLCREELVFQLPDKLAAGWSYKYQVKDTDRRGYSTPREGVAQVRFIRLERQDLSSEPLRVRGGPTLNYVTAIRCSYSDLRDRVGGFQALVNAIVAYIAKQIEHNAIGRDAALKSLAEAGGAA